MKKLEQLESVLAILAKYDITDEMCIKEVTDLIGPKTRTEDNPPILDKDGNIVEVYCQWHKCYEKIEIFAKSTKTKYGYHRHCKPAMVQWRYYDKLIKEKENEIKGIMEKVLEGEMDLDKAKKSKSKIEGLIEKLRTDRENKVTVEIPEEK